MANWNTAVDNGLSLCADAVSPKRSLPACVVRASFRIKTWS